MAYMTPEERISGLVNRGYEGLRSRFAALRGETQQAGGVPPAPSQAVTPTQPTSSSQLAKVPNDVSKVMPRQALSPSHGTIPTTNFIRSEETGNTVSMNPNGDMRWSDSAGMDISRPEGGMRGTQQPTASTGTQRAGNMDVSFDSSVSPGARAAFLQNPVKPQAQMDRYDAYVATPRGRFFGARPVGEPDNGFLTKENAPGMGWRQRMALNERMLINQQQGSEAAMREETERQGMRTSAKEQIETEAAQMGLASAKRAQSLFDAYSTEADPAKKAELLQQYKLLTGMKDSKEGGSYSVVDMPTGEVDNLGTPVTRKVMANPVTGEIFDPATKMGGGAEPLPPVDKRVVGKRYIGAGGRVAVWDGKGLIAEK